MTRRYRIFITRTITLLAAVSLISCSNSGYDPFQPAGVGGKADETEETGQNSLLQDYTSAVLDCADNLESADAAGCFARANENQAVKQRIKNGLAETRQLFSDMYDDPTLVADLIPADEQAFSQLMLLSRTAAAACDGSQEANKARCHVAAQAALSFLYVKWVTDYSEQLDEAIKAVVPPSERLSGCRAIYETTETRYQAEMNQAEADLGTCAAEANDAFVLSKANNDQAIASLNSVRAVAGEVCAILVNASDSATGSISRLYLLACRSDVETFLAATLDWMM